MKNLVYILMLLILFDPLFSQNKILKKELQISYLLGKDGKLNPDGNLIEKQYNDSGKVIYELNKSFWPEVNREVNYIRKYFYTNNVILDSVLIYEGEKFLLKVEYQNDSTGLPLSAVEILPDGKKSFTARFVYNDKNQKVKEQLFSPEGVLFTLKEYFYNSQGQLIEERGFDRGTPKYRYLFKYDKKKFLIEKKQYDANNKLIKLIKYKNNKDGLPLEFKETTYSDKEKVIKVVKFQYEYF